MDASIEDLYKKIAGIRDLLFPELSAGTCLDTIFNIVTYGLTYQLSSPRRNSKKFLIRDNASRSSSDEPRILSVGSIQRTYSETTIPIGFDTFSEICKEVYKMFRNSERHCPLFLPSYVATQVNYDRSQEYGLVFPTAFGLFTTLRVQSVEARMQLLVSTTPVLRISAPYIYSPVSDSSPGFLALGRSVPNNVTPTIADDTASEGRTCPMFYIPSHEFKPAENCFRHSFNLRTCTVPTNLFVDWNDKDLKLNTYVMKWEAVGNVRKHFNHVSATFPPCFGMLSVSTPSTLFTDAVTSANVHDLVNINSDALYDIVRE